MAWVQPAAGICFILCVVLVHFDVTLEKYATQSPNLSEIQTEAVCLFHATVRQCIGLLPAKNKWSL